MSGFEILLVLVIVVGGLYAAGVLPTAGLLRFYYRIRLVALLWALMIVLIAANRTFNLV